MPPSINYSTLPNNTPSASPWKIMRLSVLITVLFLITLGPVIYISDSMPNTQNYILAIVKVVAVAVLVLGSYRILLGKFRKQRSVMAKFAEQNGWTFDGYRKTNDTSLLPQEWRLLGSTWRQIYRINGSISGTGFELYALGGLVWAALPSGYSPNTLGYRTVVRSQVEFDPLSLPPNIQAVSEGGWNYILYNGNAFTASEIEALLLPLTAPNNMQQDDRIEY